MRYPAAEKLEIIRLVEQSHLPARRVLEQIGIPRSTFYRWCDLYQTGGPEALDDRSPRPDRVWNRIPDDVGARIVTLALDEPELSPRELAVRFTDAERYFVSEASVYRLLKAYDLITSPAFIVMKAADEFKDKTTAPDQLRCVKGLVPAARSSPFRPRGLRTLRNHSLANAALLYAYDASLAGVPSIAGMIDNAAGTQAVPYEWNALAAVPYSRNPNQGAPRPMAAPFRSGSARLGRSQKDGLPFLPWGLSVQGHRRAPRGCCLYTVMPETEHDAPGGRRTPPVSSASSR